MHERDKRGRGRVAYGINHYKAKLTEDQVRFIRNNYLLNGEGLNLQQLAELFNISKPAIFYIISRRNWKQLI